MKKFEIAERRCEECGSQMITVDLQVPMDEFGLYECFESAPIDPIRDGMKKMGLGTQQSVLPIKENGDIYACFVCEELVIWIPRRGLTVRMNIHKFSEILRNS